jgi:predicted polyphosphate/ATP-dependent NAD kinase
VSAMLAAGVRAIVVLGGDGTARAVASALDDTPLLALTTGTNNAFGSSIEPTVAGLAAGLVATGRCPVADGCRRAKQLEIRIGGHVDLALVDVAVVATSGIGARAVWHPSALRELVVTSAEPWQLPLRPVVGMNRPDGTSSSGPADGTCWFRSRPGWSDRSGCSDHDD